MPRDTPGDSPGYRRAVSLYLVHQPDRLTSNLIGMATLTGCMAWSADIDTQIVKHKGQKLNILRNIY